MTCERIDYYQTAERTNVIRLIFNSAFFCALFAAVCSFIYFYLPNAEFSSLSPVASNSSVSTEKVQSVEVSPTKDAASEDAAPAELAADAQLSLDAPDFFAQLAARDNSSHALPAKFTRGAGTASLSLHPNAANREDLGLLLYRQPQTRAAVEGFYYQVTGNRETAIAILDAAETYNIPLSLAFSLAYAESHFKPYASHVNKNGSIDRGLFQLNSNAFPNLTEEEFFNPKISALKGLKHLNYFLRTAGNEVTALAMYNAGAAKVSANNTPHSTLDYVAAINSYRSAIDESFAKDVLVFFERGNAGRFGEKVEYTQS
ncbi:MAG: transglycosylase SLT domain-containing protein [Treponema sp.]|nr:transglycosylase SLT domain-containing protein [Treponema sp.]